MALTTLEANTIARGLSAARKVLEELKPIIDGLNAIYDPDPTGAKYTITQADLDAAANLSGLTKQELDDGMYVLTAVLRDGVNNGYTQLAQLAARAERMASEIQVPYDLTGRVLYALVRNSVGAIWNGSAFVTYTTANLATYDIALAEQGTASAYYTGTFPAVPAGTYNVVSYDQQGGAPAEGDPLVGAGTIEWDGSAVVSLASRMATTAFPTNFAALSIDLNGRVKIQSGVIRNTAIAGFEFLLVLASDHVTGAPGLTVTPTRSLDGGAFAPCANLATEVAGGIYAIDLAASDLDAETVTLMFAAATADTRFIEIRTTP